MGVVGVSGLYEKEEWKRFTSLADAVAGEQHTNINTWSTRMVEMLLLSLLLVALLFASTLGWELESESVSVLVLVIMLVSVKFYKHWYLCVGVGDGGGGGGVGGGVGGGGKSW